MDEPTGNTAESIVQSADPDGSALIVPPLEEHETVYRRLPLEWWTKHSKRGTLRPVPVRFFTPKKHDTDGLSVTRSSITRADVAGRTAKGDLASLAELAVSDVTRQGLTVRPDPIPKDAGHALTPEVNILAYESGASKDEIDEYAAALAEVARVVYPTLPPPGLSISV